MKFPPAATYLSKIAKEVASSVIVPNRIAPRLSTLTLRADDKSLPMVVYRTPSRSQFARARSQTFTAANPGGAGISAAPYQAEVLADPVAPGRKRAAAGRVYRCIRRSRNVQRREELAERDGGRGQVIRGCQGCDLARKERRNKSALPQQFRPVIAPVSVKSAQIVLTCCFPERVAWYMHGFRHAPASGRGCPLRLAGRLVAPLPGRSPVHTPDSVPVVCGSCPAGLR